MRGKLILLAAFLAGCTNPVAPPAVREVDETQVAGCAFVTNIRGTPSVYGPVLGEQGIAYTRNQVIKDAAEAGANTIVFEKVSPGATVYVVNATAYRC